MMRRLRSFVLLPLALAACQTTPPVPLDAARLDFPPFRAAETRPVPPETVIWGGMIVGVENHPEHTEIEILAYPLDPRLQPMLRGPTEGRFLAILSGYVEAYDWPQGRFVTLRGGLKGVRETHLEQRPYRYPLLDVESIHLWPQGFQYDTGPNLSIGVGIGVHR